MSQKNNKVMKAPFPYFGGKSTVASKVWAALGDPDHFLEPFFGSGAVLLARAQWRGKTETVNDKDGFICNVWRALQFAPDAVAKLCDWPVNHADLAARRKELIKNEQRLLDHLLADPAWHDPVLAGYWILGGVLLDRLRVDPQRSNNQHRSSTEYDT